MNLESLVRDANPAPLASIPGPDSLEARRMLGHLTADHQGIDGRSHRSPLKRSTVWAVVAAAAAVIAAVVTPLVTDQSASLPAHSATQIPASVTQTWRLAGYITQAGLQVSSGSTSLSTSQQSTTQLACPTVTTCYSDGTNLPSLNQNSQSVITVTHDGGATWHQVLSPGHDVYFFGFTCPVPTTCMVAGAVPNTNTSPSLYTTTDGGQSWTTQLMPGSNPSAVVLSCATISDCVVLEDVPANGDNIKGVAYITSDGGHTWTNSVLPKSFMAGGSAEPGLQCFADGRCIAIGNEATSTRALQTVAMIYSTNDGATWEVGTLPQVAPSISASGLMSCADDEHCVSIESAQNDNGGITTSGVLVTNDGGETWSSFPVTDLNSVDASTPMSFDSISCSNPSDCWAAGGMYESLCQGSCPYVPNRGVLMATVNGGQTWSTVPLPTPPSQTLQYAQIFPVSCIADGNCFAVGSLNTTQSASQAGSPLAGQNVLLTNGD